MSAHSLLMINIGRLARMDHLALIAVSVLRINSSRAVIKHQMPTLHTQAGQEQGDPKDANRVWEPLSLPDVIYGGDNSCY